jgi:two-component system, OmpR family, response regulator
MRILVVEDNKILRENLKKYFEIQGFRVDTHRSYTGASYKIMTQLYDVIVLDLGLGEWEKDGLTICSEVRSKWCITPILMLTARILTDQKIEWLDAWADDYLTKPFDYKELLARINALNRREKKNKWRIVHYKEITIDKESFTVTSNDSEVHLSKTEYELLIFLLDCRWMTISKEKILEKVWWDIDLFENTRKLDIYVGYLRKKLRSDLITTVRGIWYMIP